MLSTFVHGTWLIQTSFSLSLGKTSNLHLCWHLLASLTLLLMILVIKQFVRRLPLESKKKYTQENITTIIKALPESYIEQETGLTVITNEKICKVFDEDLKKSKYSTGKHFEGAVKDETSKDIFTEVKDSKEVSIHHQVVSPLEEFNMLHRNVEGVRASIKLKESDVI